MGGRMMRIVDLFAGPGGADLGIREALPDAEIVGVEWDQAACDTRRAAGLETVQADVSQLDPADFAPVDGMWASPPCQDFSMAGKRAGIDGERGMLIHEVMRWASILKPAWIACEQVPPALPVWQLFAHELRTMGYRAWAGVLNAADYGVPQTRKRAILMASKMPFDVPEPTHAKHPQPAGLFGGEQLPWVTMAQALGWGATLRHNQAERDRPQDADGKARVAREGGGDYYLRFPSDAPAPIITTQAGAWVWEETGEERPRDPDEQPAATISGKGNAYWVNGNQPNSAVRSQDEPALTIHFGHRCNDVKWVHERPPTTVCADPRSPEPGYRGNPDDYKDDEPTRLSDNAERVTVEQAAILQGFPPDHPWQGSKTKKFEQVGNAVPPPLAAAVVAPLLDANEREVAA